MRQIVILLVVANIAFQLWYWLLGGMALLQPEEVPRSILSAESAEPLVLLSERKVQRQAFQQEEQQGECVWLGPLIKQEQGVLAQRLNAWGLEWRLREQKVASGSAFWVHLPKFISEREALLSLRNLQAKKVDSYLIPSGDLAQAISFGVFSSQAAAEVLYADMREQGYDVQLTERPRHIRQYWYSVGGDTAATLDESMWLDLLAEFPQIKREINLCEGLAGV